MAVPEPPGSGAQGQLLLLFVVGLICVVVGFVVAAKNTANLRRRRRILLMPTTKVADAMRGTQAVLELQGRIIAGEEGVFTATLSGRPAVWAEVTVTEIIRSRSNTVSQVIFRQRDSRDFYLDDDSGTRARISPKGADFDVDAKTFSAPAVEGGAANESPVFAPIHLHRGTTNADGHKRSLVYTESILSPDDLIYAMGAVRRDAGLPALEGYRTAPSTELVMDKRPDVPGELLLSNRSEAELVRKLLAPTLQGIALIVIGLVCAAIGLAFLDH